MKFKLLRGDEYEARYWMCLMKDIQSGFFQKIRAFILETPLPEAWCIPALPLLSHTSVHKEITKLPDTCFVQWQLPQLENRIVHELTE